MKDDKPWQFGSSRVFVLFLPIHTLFWWLSGVSVCRCYFGAHEFDKSTKIITARLWENLLILFVFRITRLVCLRILQGSRFSKSATIYFGDVEDACVCVITWMFLVYHDGFLCQMIRNVHTTQYKFKKYICPIYRMIYMFSCQRVFPSVWLHFIREIITYRRKNDNYWTCSERRGNLYLYTRHQVLPRLRRAIPEWGRQKIGWKAKNPFNSYSGIR